MPWRGSRIESVNYRQSLRLRLVRKYAERGLPTPQFLLASWDSLEMSISQWRRRYMQAWEDMLLYDEIGLRPPPVATYNI